MGKRKLTDREEDDAPKPSGDGPTIGQQTSHIKNKLVRSERYQRLKHEENKKKKADRIKKRKEEAKAEELGLPPPPKAIPKVIILHRHLFFNVYSL